ncbi:hypothetical protein C5167_000552 [Papaver somniferum]|uniref:Uncharacterized protein n=1 Tax=Papaver somniferum TaxID=3469 RepID=A0A4Y7KVK9_PAPSO|nr:hypothetical protein C5167_000552 [Papaver somniferum]
MAKAIHLSFFSPFLLGFLLVLCVSNLTYVRAKSCWAVGSVDLGVDPVLGDGAFIFCDDGCKDIDPNYEYYDTSFNEETGQRGCICCYWR